MVLRLRWRFLHDGVTIVVTALLLLVLPLLRWRRLYIRCRRANANERLTIGTLLVDYV